MYGGTDDEVADLAAVARQFVDLAQPALLRSADRMLVLVRPAAAGVVPEGGAGVTLLRRTADDLPAGDHPLDALDPSDADLLFVDRLPQTPHPLKVRIRIETVAAAALVRSDQSLVLVQPEGLYGNTENARSCPDRIERSIRGLRRHIYIFNWQVMCQSKMAFFYEIAFFRRKSLLCFANQSPYIPTDGNSIGTKGQKISKIRLLWRINMAL